MSLIQRLRERRQQADADLKQQQAETERRVAESRALQATAERLQRDVDCAERQLAVAEQQCERVNAQRSELCEAVGSGWGLTHADGSVLNPPAYINLVSLEAAVADFPRARKQLQSKISLARTALREFERRHAA
jgi:hypothetical protein